MTQKLIERQEALAVKVSEREFISDMYVFSLYGRHYFVGGRARYSHLSAPPDFEAIRQSVGESFLDLYLMGYRKSLYVTKFSDGVYAFIPSLVPSSSIYVVLRFAMSAETFKSLLRYTEIYDIFELSPDMKDIRCRISKKVRDIADGFAAHCDEISDCFLGLDGFRSTANIDPELALEELKGQIERLARFVGCDFEIFCDENICVTETDFSLFSAFTLIMLVEGRLRSAERRVEIHLSELSGAAVIKVSFALEDKLADIPKAILAMDHGAAERNMLFEYGYEDKEHKRFYARFHPLRRDWSYLGIKQPIPAWE